MRRTKFPEKHNADNKSIHIVVFEKRQHDMVNLQNAIRNFP